MTTTDTEGMAGAYRAVERLVVAVNTAVEEFLADRFPVPHSLTGACSISPLYGHDNPVRRELFDAAGDLVAGLARMVQLAIDRPVIAFTAGPWLDPHEGWRGGFDWDIDA